MATNSRLRRSLLQTRSLRAAEISAVTGSASERNHGAAHLVVQRWQNREKHSTVDIIDQADERSNATVCCCVLAKRAPAKPNVVACAIALWRGPWRVVRRRSRREALSGGCFVFGGATLSLRRRYTLYWRC